MVKGNVPKDLLLRIATKDDQIAFRELFHNYFGRLLNLAKYFVNSEIVAEEMVSNVFIKIWNNRSQLTGIASLDKYLYTAIKNQCYNYLRDNQRYLYQTLETDRSNLITDFQNPETQLLDNELRDVLKKAIDNLPPKCKIIFRMVREDGLKYCEAAEILGISPKTVDVQIGRAVQKLKIVVELYFENKKSHRTNKALLLIFLMTSLFV